MDTRDEIKKKVLVRTLAQVPFEGWSQDVLNQSAHETLGDASYGWRLFPKGPLEAVTFWSHLLDQDMLGHLPPPQDLRVRERITVAVKERLKLLIPHREAARKTMAYLKRPSHISTSTRLVYQTVNEMWYYAGDTSTDYNFYTKRGLLGWVYITTLSSFLRDHSEDFEKTWIFLDHRINEVLTLPKLPQKIFGSLFPWKRHG